MDPIEGIILQVHSFGEASHLLVVFTKEQGVIKTTVRSSKRAGMRGYSPLLMIQGLAARGAQEIWKSRDIRVVTTFPYLRTSYESLKMAVFATTVIKKSLPLEVPLPAIYEYFYQFLRTVSTCKAPRFGVAKLLLDIMASEGLFIPEAIKGVQHAPMDTLIDDEVYEKVLSSYQTAFHINIK